MVSKSESDAQRPSAPSPSNGGPQVQAAIELVCGMIMIVSTATFGLLAAGLCFLAVVSVFTSSNPSRGVATPEDWLRDIVASLVAAAIATVIQFVARAKEGHAGVQVGAQIVFAMLMAFVALTTGPFELPVQLIAWLAAVVHALVAVGAFVANRN